MNRRLKAGAADQETIRWIVSPLNVKRFHDQLQTQLTGFIAACNFARRLQTPSGLSPYECIGKIWASEPDRFIGNPIQQRPGMNS